MLTTHNRAEQMAADDTNCKNYGYKAGTPEYAKCRMTLDTHRGDRRALSSSSRSLPLNNSPYPFSQGDPGSM